MDRAACRTWQLSDPPVRVVRVVWELFRRIRIALLAFPGRRTHGRERDGARVARRREVKATQAHRYPGCRCRGPARTLLDGARGFRFAVGIGSRGALRRWCGATWRERRL